MRWAVEDLIGVWSLIAYVDLDEEGGSHEGPLGPDPRGLLIYGDHGHMSVSMMRGDHATAPASATVFMGYAGTWRPVDGVVKHDVTVSAHPFQVGTELTREAELDGERLVLHGVAIIDGRPRRRRLTWQRVPAPASAQRPAGMSSAQPRY
ncbi:lipocalin-like domain-containing protein [Streptomyces sp. NPDC048362]|uniref:lipocalin-like domain-containing protein n=1 Tax=Streptomyces sp. NPDC048362 TaxID=3365539 RepID=UPI0037168BF2